MEWYTNTITATASDTLDPKVGTKTITLLAATRPNGQIDWTCGGTIARKIQACKLQVNQLGLILRGRSSERPFFWAECEEVDMKFWLRWILPVLGMALFVLLLYWPGLYGGFFFDDSVNFLEPDEIRIKDLSLELPCWALGKVEMPGHWGDRSAW